MCKKAIDVKDMGFIDEDDPCVIKFTERASGSPRCRLVFSESVSNSLREVTNGHVAAVVDSYGNIVVKPSGNSLTIQGDTHVWISLDKHARSLLQLFGGDTVYDSVMMNGTHIVALAARDYPTDSYDD